MTDDFNKLGKTRTKKELFDFLENSYEFEVPESMVKLEFDSLWAQTKDKPEEGSKEEKKEQEKLQQLATRRVRLGMLLSETGRKQNLGVTQQEIREAVYEQARNYPGQEQKVIEFYNSQPELLQQLEGPILEEKVVDYIIENTTQKEVEVSTQELNDYFEKDETENA